MKIIYYDRLGTYLAVVAAAIHLAELSEIEEWKWQQLEELTYFAAPTKLAAGEITFVGMDSEDNEVYILGSQDVGAIIERTAEGIKRIFAISSEEVFVDLTQYEGWRLQLGEILHKHSVRIGERLIISQLRAVRAELLEVVNDIKRK